MCRNVEIVACNGGVDALALRYLDTSLNDSSTAPVASVLLVDDDDLLVRMLTRTLRSAGHHVEAASDVRHALSLAARVEPTVLVADAILPDGNGFSVALHLRKGNPRLGVVLISGHEQSELCSLGAPPSNSEFLLKPFSREALKSAIARVTPHA